MHAGSLVNPDTGTVWAEPDYRSQSTGVVGHAFARMIGLATTRMSTSISFGRLPAISSDGYPRVVGAATVSLRVERMGGYYYASTFISPAHTPPQSR